MESNLLEKLAEKSITKQALYDSVAQDFRLLPEIVSGISSTNPQIRYGCGATLMKLSAVYPEKMYPYMDIFLALLDSKHRILLWNAMAIIANLCVVDAGKKFDSNFTKYYNFIHNDYLVTVANLVSHSSKIALAKPYLVPRITNELLKVENIQTTPHLTAECKKVIAEKAIESFSAFYDKMNPQDKAKVQTFVRKQTNSSREALKKKAQILLKQMNQ